MPTLMKIAKMLISRSFDFLTNGFMVADEAKLFANPKKCLEFASLDKSTLLILAKYAILLRIDFY